MKIFFVVVLFFFFFVSSCNSELMEDREALLSFLLRMPHRRHIQWTDYTSICSWFGVTCDSAGLSVIRLRLPGAGLSGTIPPNTLGRLLNLRVLSLRGNRISGELPPDFSNLTRLHGLFLQNNNLSGGFPMGILACRGINSLDLSGNRLSGEIPVSLRNLTRLNKIYLQGNQFRGEIPDIGLPALRVFNVSDNDLSGSIPNSMSKFPLSSFTGNAADLCGGPLPPCPETPSPPLKPKISPFPPKSRPRRSSASSLIVISIVVPAILLTSLFLVLCLCRKRVEACHGKHRPASEEASLSKEEEVLGKRRKLVFLESAGPGAFDLEDLLRASAEVLGKGSVGASYRAELEDGSAVVVVKRLKEVLVSEKEFELQIRVLGKVNHKNLVPLKAYYYSTEEKLLLSEFMEAGSLSSLLHGSSISGRALLQWEQRLKIAIAAGRGLAHLHLSAFIVHGNVKSSNVLLHPDLDASIADHGLYPLFGHSAAPTATRLPGYRAPELAETRRPTFKSDVFSFGVFLLELLTGRPPSQPVVANCGDEEGIDLVRWVQSVVREEWTAEVFDGEMSKYECLEEEMVALLQVALACVSFSPDQRPPMGDVVSAMEEVQKRRRGSSSDEGPSRITTTGSQMPTSPNGTTRPPPFSYHHY